MTKSTITDERITSVIERLEHFASNLKWTDVRGAQDLLTAADGLRELQERRKADSEPAIIVGDDGGDALAYRRLIQSFSPGTKLYRHAQPAPVVPDAATAIRACLSEFPESARDIVEECADIAENACRAAMLHGADGKPELTVWYGAMPETNGKTNWTAILHRKGQQIWEGITIDRSEYPDRVRYEADRMRHLIGELPDEPDILSYDADAHSGYVKPGNSPVIPDGYVMVPKDPTAEMQSAGASAIRIETTALNKLWTANAVFRAMLAAAPQEVK